MKILRLPLHDVIAADADDVFYYLKKIKESLTFDFLILLWYTPKRINQYQLNAFHDSYKDIIKALEVNVHQILGVESTVWFDIIGENEINVLRRFKFRLTYKDTSQLPVKLLEFGNFVKSYNKTKYAEKNSNNRFPKMGRQNKN